MSFNNNFGNVTKPFKDSPFTQNFEKEGTPLPPPEVIYVVDYLGRFVVTSTGARVIYNPLD